MRETGQLADTGHSKGMMRLVFWEAEEREEKRDEGDY